MYKILIGIALFILTAIQGVVAQIREIQESPTGISRRLQHEIDMTKDPVLGYVPKSELIRAYQLRKRLVQEKLSSGDRAVLDWTERGPYKDVVGVSNGNTRAGNAITAGRVRAMWVDLADPTGNTVWVGGVDGGLWKTTNISVRPTTWTPINDFFGNLSIGSICQDPTNHDILYFGTGEKAYNADAVRGAGLWMSTDHGVTWTPMTGTSGFYNVSKMICDAQGNLYVGCIGSASQGLKRYTKANSTWADITPTGLDKRIPDFDLSSTGRLHVICGYFTATSTGYRYTDSPATVSASTWTSAVAPPPTAYNVAIASSGNTLYALPANSSWEVPTLYKSTDGGVNWSPITAPVFTSGQAWYCMAVAIDPNNSNNVLVGSLDCYRSTNGGSSWTKVSNWVGTSGQYVHADQQAMIWRADNRVLVASDGGIHLSSDGGLTFTDRNEGLRIKQFYSVAVHPTQTDYLLGGTQDNGTHSLNQPGLASSIEVTGGDGAFVHIDQNNGNYQFGAYVYNQYRRSTNNGANWSSVNYSSNTGRFINPTDYDDVNDNMYCAAGADQYLVWSNPATTSTAGFTIQSAALAGRQVSAIKVSPFTNHTIYLGTSTASSAATILKVDNANTAPVATSIGAGMYVAGGYVSSIELGTTANNIIACYSNYGVNNVWVTTDGGSTWATIDGNLPNMPVRWGMFFPGDNTKAIIATETGIWQTDLINGSSTVWAPETSFPNVRTDMLQYRASDGLIAAATHGRGMFTAYINNPTVCSTVSNLSTSNITSSSATISWAALGSAASYDVELSVAGSNTWTTVASQISTTSVALSGLASSTTYNWRVRATCTNGVTGQFVQQQFSTLSSAPVCSAPTNLASSNITTSGATVSWSAVSGASSYLLQYKASASTSWITADAAIPGTSFVLSGLTANTTYQWQVQTNCSTGTSSFTAAQFTTQPVTTSCQSAYDTNSNNTYTGASLIPFNTDITGLINPSGDQDFYKIVITTGGTATMTLSNLVTNFDLYLYGSNGTSQLGKSTKTGTASESLTYNFTAGTYYILVKGKASSNWNATSCYSLRVQLGTATEQFFVQEEEEEETVLSLQVFPNPVQQTLHIYLVGASNGSFLDIIDQSGRQLFRKEVTSMLTSLDVNELVNGLYFVRLTNAEGKVLKAQQIIKAH